ncbi:MAG: hypothetical protein ACYTG3_08375 [Planctomycetota bacterium]|jgi:hypothetical protein
MTYYHKKSSPVPWIAGVVLLAAFIGIVVHYSGSDEPEIAGPPLAHGRTGPAPTPEPEPYRDPSPEEPYEPPPPPKPKLSTAQARKMLREATKEWRAFTVRLCKTQRWKSDRAVAFLEKVTWNDRDLDKQHSNGLASLRKMLGVSSTDPVVLAEALAGAGSLPAFFERNWSKVDVGPEETAAEKKETVLEDNWKSNRIRWGFPLDTPVDALEAFKRAALPTSQRIWHGVAATYIQSLDISETEKGPKLQAALGQGFRTREAKLRAGLQVLLDRPDASLREVVEELLRRVQETKREEFIKSLSENREKTAKAVKAAEGAE